jgi:hypothetical protein
MGSDVERDGMFLELYEGADAHSGSPLAEYFYSDVDGSMTLTEYERGVPAAALAWLQSEGARRLGEVAPYLGDPNVAIQAAPPSTLDENVAFFELRGEPPVTFDELFASAGALYVKLGRTASVPDAEEVRDLAPLRYAVSLVPKP